MSIRDPQRDLPAGVRGGSDAWDVPQASVILTGEFFESGSVPAIELTAQSVAVPQAISSAAVSQAHALAAQSLALGPAISAATVVQTHVLQGSWPSDPATPSLLSQPLLVDGEPVLVDGEPVMVTQAGVVQPLAISAGAVVVAHALSAQSLAVPLATSAEAIGQIHVLAGASMAMPVAFSAGAVSDGSEPPEVQRPTGAFGGLAAGPDAVIPRDEFLRRFGSVPGSTPSHRARARARHRREEALLLGR